MPRSRKNNLPPRYARLSRAEFKRRIALAREELTHCRLCPRQCGVNRLKGEKGFCRALILSETAHWQIHNGEEPPLSGAGGAGAIFFARCNLRCVYCQNFQISQKEMPRPQLDAAALSGVMLELQNQGAQNIDLVSPAHYLPQIMEAVFLAREQRLNIPLVYNSNGYDSPAALERLNGIVDIYLPDLKYADESAARQYSGAADYVAAAGQALPAMHAQAGDLVLDKNGRAQSGVLVRHLVLPRRLAGSFAVLDFLREKLGTGIGLSLMSQYVPCYQARAYPALSRQITPEEYEEVVDYAARLGFRQCWIQHMDSSETYLPDFERRRVFRE